MADCKYTPDGTDTDGTDYFHCLTHDRLEPSPDAHCGGNDDSPAHVAQLWTWGRDYNRAWAPTTDPRILAVVERDADPLPPGGDVFAPAYLRDRGDLSPIGDTYRDAEADDVAEAWQRARDYFVNWHYSHPRARRLDADKLTARYLRIFYGASYREVSSTIHRGYDVVIFDTPGWREHTGAVDPATWRVSSVTAPGAGLVTTEHVGMTEAEARAAHLAGLPDADQRRITRAERVSILDGDAAEWQAYLDGDVYGIGYAIRDDGAAIGDDVDLDELEVEVNVWGYYGEEYAQREALEQAVALAEGAVEAAAETLAALEAAEAAERAELHAILERVATGQTTASDADELARRLGVTQ